MIWFVLTKCLSFIFDKIAIQRFWIPLSVYKNVSSLFSKAKLSLQIQYLKSKVFQGLKWIQVAQNSQ